MISALDSSITTKLRPPRLRTSLVARPGLAEKLGWEAGRNKALTIIVELEEIVSDSFRIHRPLISCDNYNT